MRAIHDEDCYCNLPYDVLIKALPVPGMDPVIKAVTVTKDRTTREITWFVENVSEDTEPNGYPSVTFALRHACFERNEDRTNENELRYFLEAAVENNLLKIDAEDKATGERIPALDVFSVAMRPFTLEHARPEQIPMPNGPLHTPRVTPVEHEDTRAAHAALRAAVETGLRLFFDGGNPQVNSREALTDFMTTWLERNGVGRVRPVGPETGKDVN